MVSDNSITIGGYPLGGIVRRVRRKADFSQRELARFAKVSPASIGAIETGAVTPSLPVLQRILNAANYQLLVADADGRLVTPLEVWQGIADGAGRRFPAHLDTILDPAYGEWWADVYGLTSPPETFRRNRRYRDWQRQRSRWEVRVKQLRFTPPPGYPYGKRGWQWQADPVPPAPSDPFDVEDLRARQADVAQGGAESDSETKTERWSSGPNSNRGDRYSDNRADDATRRAMAGLNTPCSAPDRPLPQRQEPACPLPPPPPRTPPPRTPPPPAPSSRTPPDTSVPTVAASSPKPSSPPSTT